MAGIYIHIPFCSKACHYCNFHFSTSRHQMPQFIEALLKEVEDRHNYLNNACVQTIYFGGGTPSLLSAAQLQAVLRQLKALHHISPSAEVTLEANPNDINTTRLAEWSAAGINRLSIGVQSFFDADLQWMNRAHNAADATACIALAQQMGFHNITIDLIYGTPTLTDAQWLHNIDTAVALGVPHLSCYALTVEPQTALDKMIQKQKIANVDPEKQARHFEMLMDRLQHAGFEHYEISNFARPGYRSRHNSSYWQGVPYVGYGPSAHSFNGHSRQWNVANNALYIQALQNNLLHFEQEVLTPQQQLNEYIMTSLRTSDGMSTQLLESRFGAAIAAQITGDCQALIQQGLLHRHHHHLVLTQQGKLLADGIAADLFRI